MTPAPEEVRARRRRLLLVAAGAALLVYLPRNGFVRGEAFLFDWALIWGLVGLSVNVLTGYAGQMSLAQAALMGSGAFTLGILVTQHGVSWWLALPVAGLVTSAVTLIIGLPALRIRGLYLAIVTLGFQYLMNRVVFRQQWLTRGASGIDIEPPRWIGGRPLGGGAERFAESFLYVILAVLVLVWVADRNLARTRGGRAFFAIREDEQVAASFGISVARYKLLAFAISGFYAGVAGALFSTLNKSAGPELYDYDRSLQLLVYGVIGGLGSRLGVFWGAMFPIFLQRILQRAGIWINVIGGGLLLLTLTRYRGGLAEQGRELAHLGRRLWADRRRVARGLRAFALLPWRAWRRRREVAGTALALWRARRHLPALARARRQARLEARLAAAAASTLALEELRPSLEELGAGDRPVLSLRPRRLERSRRGPLLEVRDLSVRFGGVQALDGVSLEVREGEIVGLMGPNGAGKTTLFNCVSGFVRPQAGTVWFKGQDVTRLPPHERARLGFGRTFQNIGLVKSETVLGNYLIAQHAVAGYGPLEGALYTSAVRAAEEELRARARTILDRLGLGAVAERVVRDLPHGLLKLVELGAALVTGPEVLLLDEPSSGMSPPEAQRLGETLRRIRDAFEVTVLMIEHHVPLVLEVADYVYVLNFGKLLAEGEVQEVARHPEVVAAYLGSEAGAGAEEAAL